MAKKYDKGPYIISRHMGGPSFYKNGGWTDNREAATQYETRAEARRVQLELQRMAEYQGHKVVVDEYWHGGVERAIRQCLMGDRRNLKVIHNYWHKAGWQSVMYLGQKVFAGHFRIMFDRWR